jgi:AraC-like DNA-binding protein
MLAESEQRGAGYKSALRGMLIELLVLLARARLSPGNATTRPADRLAVLVSQLEERFYEEWPLSRMAEVAGCSVPSLSRHFRALVKRSPNDYLLSLRISRARQLLLNTDLSVTRIADQTGFCDSNYLTRQFRRRVGMTPRSYRRGITG